MVTQRKQKDKKIYNIKILSYSGGDFFNDDHDFVFHAHHHDHVIYFRLFYQYQQK